MNHQVVTKHGFRERKVAVHGRRNRVGGRNVIRGLCTWRTNQVRRGCRSSRPLRNELQVPWLCRRLACRFADRTHHQKRWLVVLHPGSRRLRTGDSTTSVRTERQVNCPVLRIAHARSSGGMLLRLPIAVHVQSFARVNHKNFFYSLRRKRQKTEASALMFQGKAIWRP